MVHPRAPLLFVLVVAASMLRVIFSAEFTHKLEPASR